MVLDSFTQVHPSGRLFGRQATVRHLIQEMDNAEVQMAMVASTIHAPEAAAGLGAERASGGELTRSDEIRRINDFVAETVARYSGRLLGYGSIHPGIPGAAEEVVRCARDLNLAGLFLHPAAQGIAPRDPALVPLVKQAGSLGLVVTVHAVPMLGSGHPEDIVWLALQCPKATILMLHIGAHRFSDALGGAFLRRQYPHADVLQNLFYSLGLTPSFFRGGPYWEHLTWMLRRIGPEQIVYSSCFPEGQMMTCLRAVETLHFSKHERQRILSENLRGLLGVGASTHGAAP